MRFVNKQHTVFLAFQGTDHILELFLKLATILAASQQAAHLQAPDFVPFQKLRNCIVGYSLSQSIHDSSFTHARISHHQHIGLESTCQHSDHFFNFCVASNHWFQSIFFGQLCETGTVFFQNFISLLISHAVSCGMIVIGFPKLDKLCLAHTILEQEVVSMTVGFAHDGQVHVCCGNGSTTCKQDLCQRTIKHTL